MQTTDTTCREHNGDHDTCPACWACDFLCDCTDAERAEASKPKHAHYYRDDIADWWCTDCDTVTDYCTQQH